VPLYRYKYTLERLFSSSTKNGNWGVWRICERNRASLRTSRFITRTFMLDQSLALVISSQFAPK